jgi:hypothetical protein
LNAPHVRPGADFRFGALLPSALLPSCPACDLRATIGGTAHESVHQLARRRFLQAGTMALFAGAAPTRVARGFSPESATGIEAFGRAKHCILIYLLGGPPCSRCVSMCVA